MEARFFVRLVIACSIAVACSKDNTNQTVSIAGTWELRTVYHGQGGSVHYPAGNGYISKFTSDTYEVDSAGKLISSGTYRIVKEKVYLTGETGDRIIYDNNTADIKTFLTLSHDTLSFFIDAYDAGGTTYVKQ